MSLRFYPSNQQCKDCFMAALYGRLSEEDKKESGAWMESASITNQRNYLHYCVEQLNQPPAKWKVKIYREYYDDDYTGITFLRPGFQAMMEDIKNGLVDCVIVKDFSRFGRDHDRIKKYLEEDFEEKGHEVRFIAYADHYDSLIDRPDLGVRILLFLNEEYSRNQSYKVATGMESMMRAGQFIGAFAPYGYKKSEKDKHFLVVDEQAADIVKRIFYMAVEKKESTGEIAAILNKEQVPSPSEYKRRCGLLYQCGNQKRAKVFWSSATVLKILTDEVYTGVLVQHKVQTINLKTKQRRSIEKAKQIRVENRHEAIVSRECFEKASAIVCRATHKKSRDGREYPLDGLVWCKECNSLMLRNNGKQYEGKNGSTCYICYECKGHKKHPEISHAPRIYERVILSVIQEDLSRRLKELPSERELLFMLSEKEKGNEKSKEEQKLLHTLQKKLQQIEKTVHAVDEKWLLNQIGNDERKKMKEYYEKKRKYLSDQIETLTSQEKKACALLSELWIKDHIYKLSVDVASKNLIRLFVDHIDITKDREIHIFYKFQSTD